MSQTLTGRIFNIQHFSVHDGPNIRDLIFMKGCPLRCGWCSNPESQSGALQIAYNAAKCIGCGQCVDACPVGALSKGHENFVVRDFKKCTSCGQCAVKCCSYAMHVFGEDVTVNQLLRHIRSGMTTWRAEGGVTVSGGEPLLQADFVAAFLKAARGEGLHTAIETTFHASWESIAKVAESCDLVFCDLKLFNSEKHRVYTGVGNALILENIAKFSMEYVDIDFIVRTPLIPNVNDQPEELDAIVGFLSDLPHMKDYELLPYHNFAMQKYRQLGRAYALENTECPDRGEVLSLNNALRQRLGLPMQDS